MIAQLQPQLAMVSTDDALRDLNRGSVSYFIVPLWMLITSVYQVIYGLIVLAKKRVQSAES